MLLPLALAITSQTPISPSKVTTPTQALQRLKNGNARSLKDDGYYITNLPNRNALALKQKPYAVILGCADSRVAPEILFDEGLGELFVVRVAGNIVDPPTLGSVEYGVRNLGAKLIVVLGHESCGAVSTAMAPVEVRNTLSENIRFLLDRVETGGQKDLHAATIANVRYQLSLLKADPALEPLIKAGKVGLVGGFYNIATGKVEFIK